MLPSLMRFGPAYYHHRTLPQVAHMMASGLLVKVRPEAMIYGFSCTLAGWSVMERLGEIQTPTLVLAGREDFQFPPEHQQALGAGIPHATLRLIENAGHNSPKERPDEVVAAVRQFLAE